MADIQIDKIKLAFSQMNDEYWEKVSVRATNLTEKAAKLTTDINSAFTTLAMSQMNILETKRKGYERLLENKKKTAVAEIVKENKERIDQLTGEKSNTVIMLSILLNDLTYIIKEVQTLGEGGKNG